MTENRCQHKNYRKISNSPKPVWLCLNCGLKGAFEDFQSSSVSSTNRDSTQPTNERSEYRTLLTELGLEQYIEVFADNEIDEESFWTLNNEDLKDLGIDKVGHRKKILGLLEKSPSNVESHATTPIQDTNALYTKLYATSLARSTVQPPRSPPPKKKLSFMTQLMRLWMWVMILFVAALFAIELSAPGPRADRARQQQTNKPICNNSDVESAAQYNADRIASTRGTRSPPRCQDYPDFACNPGFTSCVKRNWTFANCAGRGGMYGECMDRVVERCCL